MYKFQRTLNSVYFSIHANVCVLGFKVVVINPLSAAPPPQDIVATYDEFIVQGIDAKYYLVPFASLDEALARLHEVALRAPGTPSFLPDQWIDGLEEVPALMYPDAESLAVGTGPIDHLYAHVDRMLKHAQASTPGHGR